MIHAAVDAVRQSAEEGGPKPLLFAVTVLTSMAPGELPGYGENLSGLAADLAAGGQAWGLDGVVCSGHEVEAIKSRCPGLMCLTPGIRPGPFWTRWKRRKRECWEGEGNPSLEGAPPLPTPHPLPSQDFRARYPACLHMRERADRNPSLELFGFFNS